MTRPRTRPSGTRRPTALSQLRADEAASILRALLERHPELTAEATVMAEAAITGAHADGIANAVEHAILALDIDALGDRAGEHGDGYTSPTEAAWELLQEALDPFLDDLRRQIALRAASAAIESCKGIVLGLYRVRGKNRDAVLGWAEDFPAEGAGLAVDLLSRADVGARGAACHLPQDFVDEEVPDWADIFARRARKRRR